MSDLIRLVTSSPLKEQHFQLLSLIGSTKYHYLIFYFFRYYIHFPHSDGKLKQFPTALVVQSCDEKFDCRLALHV